MNGKISGNYTKALMLMVFTLVCMAIFSCKEDPKPDIADSPKISTNTAVVIFTVGDVSIEGVKLKQGDILQPGIKVTTGKKSSCELQVREHESEIVIQLKQNSEFILEDKTGPGEVKSSVTLGNALFKVNKPLKKGESIQVVAPTFVAGVRGTEFSLDVAKNGDSKVSVVSGKVSAIHRIAELDDLPTDIIEKSQFLQNSVYKLEENETIIEPGEKVLITKKESDKILNDSRIKEAIKIAKSSSTDESGTAIALKIDDNFRKTVNVNKEAIIPAPVVQKMEAKDLQKQIKEFENLIALEQIKLQDSISTNAELKKINEERKEIMIQKIEEITGKASETLILTSGTKVKGVIFQEGDTYIVLTPEGRKEFQESEVEGTEF
ncbi:FecR family protein [Leptospira sp. GIMC2001]|uniref:FecR family protein n=1 Tax=Leptospira sp. GIMC2001 TaxID=1513297 RepID=UPI0004A5C6C5|nr:FecR family protein [Leptospira sp. GIMC2001]AID56209.1 LipL45 protein [Leptospira sp. GIMC2001]WCL49628.1 FecR family protein [Leptospira sp. GIMC2001]